jgi:hypothetical protein
MVGEDKMYRLITFFLLFSISLIAYNDMDMDGVEDKDDQCPNTSLTELVDLTGCTIKELKSPHHFDISIGHRYTKNSNIKINTTSIQADYFYKNLSLQLATSCFNREVYNKKDSGLNNTYINGYYQLRATERLLFRVGGGVSLPTYDESNNKSDYTLATYGTYRYNNLSILGGVGYTLIGDSDTNRTSYNNTLFYNFGIGYYLSSMLYSSISYNNSSSIYNSIEDIETISLYNYYKIDENWFLNISYNHGLNDISMKQSIGVRVGYYW